MRCKFCFFDNQLVVPNAQHPALSIIKPFFQVTACKSCYSTNIVRGPLLGGEVIEVGSLHDDIGQEPTLEVTPKIAELRNARKTVVVAASRHRSRTLSGPR